MNKCYKAFLLVIFSFCCLTLQAQKKKTPIKFQKYFENATLRLDYVFAGSNKSANIYVDKLNKLNGWYGRRHNLDSLFLKGYGSITMRDKATNKIIYKKSFSSLFLEWLSTDEAKHVSRAFQNVFLVPYPKRPITISVELRNFMGKHIASFRHDVDPHKNLIYHRTPFHSPDTTYMLRSGNPQKCIDVVIMAEGYTQNERSTFLNDAQTATQALLATKPFKTMKSRFNIVALFTPSLNSGVSVPHNKIWRHTAFGSHFDTFYSNRYLTTQNVEAIHDALIGVPYEHIIILANTYVYGGGGIYNSYTLTAAHNIEFKPVVVHEFGHSFGGLADEYFYDNDVMTNTYNVEKEPWEQNVTTLVDFKGKKWSNLIPKGTPIPTPIRMSVQVPIGLYQGAAYSAKGFYRCSYDCRMRTNVAPGFCPACQLDLKRLINFYTN